MYLRIDIGNSSQNYIYLQSPAIMAEIDNSIESYRRIVEGTPQEAFFFEDDPNVALICNEEGKLLNLPANRVIQSDI